MKELRIPVPSEQFINLSEIDRYFRGLIISYNGDVAVGYLQYMDGSWYFLKGTDGENYQHDDESLVALVSYLIKAKLCTHFKVIEFAQ